MMDWIAVEDKVPYENQKVIYFFELLGTFIGTYNAYVHQSGHVSHQFGGRYGFLTDDVTHWMPLPEPPTAGRA